MNPVKILKSKLKSITISDTIPARSMKKFDKEKFIKDAKQVRKTFSDEDLLPRVSTI